MKKKIIITGGCGFIGSNLAEKLINKYQIIIIDDLSVGSIQNIKHIKDKITFIKKDINKINNLNNKLFKNVYGFIHLAAKAEIVISKDKEINYFDDNIRAVMTALAFCKKNNIKKFIFSSSASVYGNTGNKKVNEKAKSKPLHYYGFTKYISENIISNYCRINKLNFTILRFFNVYGKRSNAVISKFINQKIASKEITVYGDGNQKRDFIYVDSVSQVIQKCLQKSISSNKVYNVGTGKSKSIKSIVRILKHKHINLDKRFDDIEISISCNNKIVKDLGLNFDNNFEKNIIQIENFYKKNKKFKIESIETQKKNLKKFNNI